MEDRKNIVRIAAIAGAVLLVAILGYVGYNYFTSDDLPPEPSAASDGTATDTAPPTPPANGGNVPYAKILIVDRNMVLSQSSVGQDIMKQVQSQMDTARAGLKGREDALKAEYSALQQQISILAPAVKEGKIKAFEAKQQALQADVQKQQLMIQGGLDKARQQVILALRPILHKIMVERGANMLVEKGTLADGTPELDISADAIARLNAVLPSLKVTPQMPPQRPGGEQ